MKNLILSFVAVAFVQLCFLLPAHALKPVPISTYLTFQQQTTHDNITVNVYLKHIVKGYNIHFDDHSHMGSPMDYANHQEATLSYISGADRSVASFQLKNLSPGKTYYFVTGNDEVGYSKEYKFKTLPNNSSPIKVLQGGDMGPSDKIPLIAKSSLEQNPDVILIGGDIAYANGNTKNTNKWDQWFGFMNSSMTNGNGFLVPLILAIGNHETNLLKLGKSRVPFFYTLFPQKGRKSYFKRFLGDHSVLYVLDTGHDTPHFGKQAKWLKKNMKGEKRINKIALYHIPLYPGHRSYSGPQSVAGRASWQRYFDRYGLKLAMENHDHTLKRTHLIKDDKVVNTNGVLYIGDGCWGKNSREAKKNWYTKVVIEQTHVWNVTLAPNKISGHAEGEKGRVFDKFELITGKNSNTLAEPKSLF